MLEDRWHGRESSIGPRLGEGPSQSAKACAARGRTIAAMDAVVFDWDGTLVDTLPAILRANTEVLVEYGLTFDEDRYRAAYVPDWRLMYQRLGVPDVHLEAAGARWLALYRAAEPPRPFRGVRRALRRLAAAGYVMGLVTAGHRALVDEQLEHLGLLSVLPVRVCGDDPVPAKPDPEPLRRALDGLAVGDRPEHAIYVGDAPDDMRMARAVGARAVGIVSTLGTAADLRAAGADEVAPSVGDWVEGFLGARKAEAT
jgi:HAD superfamily hydrolase (TIGR01509 family)